MGEAAPCPNCGSADPADGEWIDKDRNIWRLTCEDCGFAVESNMTQQELIDALADPSIVKEGVDPHDDEAWARTVEPEGDE